MKLALVTSILALLASASLVLAQSNAPAIPTTAPPVAAQSLVDRNRAVALRVFNEIFNQCRPEVAAEIYSPNFRNHGIHSDASLEVDQGWARGELQAFPDLRMTVIKTVAENDLVTILWIFRGTHARDGYGGFPPTGTYMEFRGMTIFRVVDGRIVEEWTTFNQWSAYSQVLQHLRWWIIAAVCLFLLAWLYIGHLVFKWLGHSRRPVPVG
ncbi:MAG: ester cyclase [Terracidiphilus sp.]